MRIHSHTTVARRCKCRELVAEPAAFVEQFTRSVAFHPIFELLDMVGVLEVRERHLMRAPSPLDRLAVHELWPGPAFWRAEDDHGPTRPLHRIRRGTRRILDPVNLRYDRIKRAGQTLMHHGRDVAFHEIRFIAVTAKQVGQFLVADASEHGRIGDLEPIEMKDRKNRTITRRIQKLVGMPTRGERTSFRLTVADDAGHDQIRIVECRAVCMDEAITEFAPFMDRPGSFRRDMTWDAVRPGELPKEPLQPVSAALDIRKALRVGPFEIAMRDQPRTAMTGTDDINHVQIVFFDQPVQVYVNEVEPGRGAPMPE